MGDKHREFLIEQILKDASAGYLVERAKWRHLFDDDKYMTDEIQRQNGIKRKISRTEMDPNHVSTTASFSNETNDKHNTDSSWQKHLIAEGLWQSLARQEFDPKAVAKNLKYFEDKGTNYGATLKPETVITLCKQCIQSFLASMGSGANSYSDKKDISVSSFNNPNLNISKKDVLMLSKTINSPEFFKAVKKYFSGWGGFLRRKAKPNTKSRLADV